MLLALWPAFSGTSPPPVQDTTTISTISGSPHPVNCAMAGNETVRNKIKGVGSFKSLTGPSGGQPSFTIRTGPYRGPRD